MKKNELEKKLINLAINPSCYNLNGSIANGGTVLFENYDKWQVINIGDKGEQEVIEFKTESDACDYIYKVFLRLNEISQHNYISKSSKKKKDVINLPIVINL
jgi:predicted secreted Zn-dependent protease